MLREEEKLALWFARVLAQVRRRIKNKDTRLGVNNYGWLDTVCCNATNKRIFLTAYAVTLLRKDEKFALCKALLCAGSRPSKTQNKKQRTPYGVLCFLWSGLRGSNPPPSPWQGDALPNELNPHFLWCLRSESNQRHGDFQSPALPTELQRHKPLS